MFSFAKYFNVVNNHTHRRNDKSSNWKAKEAKDKQVKVDIFEIFRAYLVQDERKIQDK